MVDVTTKPEVYREAKAKGTIKLKPETIQLIKAGKIEKGKPLRGSKGCRNLGSKEHKLNDSPLSPFTINWHRC